MGKLDLKSSLIVISLGFKHRTYKFSRRRVEWVIYLDRSRLRNLSFVCHPGVFMYRAGIIGRIRWKRGPAVGTIDSERFRTLIYVNTGRLSEMGHTTTCLVGYLSRSARPVF